MTTTHLLWVVYDIYKPEAIYVASHISILVAILSVLCLWYYVSFSHVSENHVLHTDKNIYSLENIIVSEIVNKVFWNT